MAVSLIGWKRNVAGPTVSVRVMVRGLWRRPYLDSRFTLKGNEFENLPSKCRPFESPGMMRGLIMTVRRFVAWLSTTG